MADAPGHMLEIPASLGRDVDKAKAGRLKADLPVEAFMTDAALAQVEQQTRAKNEPVHMEQLTAISPGEAKARRTQHGETLPSMPATRRVIPRPFQRPRIEAGSHGKTWQFVPAREIAGDDIIPGVGCVADVDEQTVYATRGEILGVEVVTGEGQPMGRLLGADGQPVERQEEKVAIGIAIVVTGIDGCVKAYRETDMVKVFRKAAGES